MSGTRGGPLPHPQPGHFSHRCEWPLSARKHVPRVHTGRDSRHKALAASAFPLLVGHQCLTLARKYLPCVHKKRGFRQSSPPQAGRCQKVSPACTRETSFPTRDSPTRAFSLLAWHLCWADARKSPPCVHARRDSRHWLARRAIELRRGGAAGPSRRPHAGRPPSHGSRCPGTPLRPIPFYQLICGCPQAGRTASSASERDGTPVSPRGRAYLSSIVPLELRSSPPRVLGRRRFRIRIRTMAGGTRCEHFRRRIFAQSLGRN